MLAVYRPYISKESPVHEAVRETCESWIESYDTMFFGEFGYKYNGGRHDAKYMSTAVTDILNHVNC